MIMNGLNKNINLNALTIDVEEWYQTVFFNKAGYKNDMVTDLAKNIDEILELLEEYNIKATFFIVGLVAEKYPDLVKRIKNGGHEIGSHGYSHNLIYELSKEQFAEEAKKSTDIIEGIIKDKIIGYRASTWSITSRMTWAIDVLESLGFKYDSSIYPKSFNFNNSYKRFPFEIKKGFIEFPPSTSRFLMLNLPFAGGIFMRFNRPGYIYNGISKVNKMGFPALIYFHSWEFSNDKSLSGIPTRKRFIQYGNIGSIKKKLNFLFKNFKFCPIRDLLGF